MKLFRVLSLRFYLLLLLSATVHAQYIYDVFGNLVPPDSPLVITSVSDFLPVVQAATSSIGEKSGYGIINAGYFKASFRPSTIEESASFLRTKTYMGSLEVTSQRFSSNRIVISGHVNPSGDYRFRYPNDMDVNISPRKLGKKLGPFVKDDTLIDLFVCGSSSMKKGLHDFAEGIAAAGARGVRVRGFRFMVFEEEGKVIITYSGPKSDFDKFYRYGVLHDKPPGCLNTNGVEIGKDGQIKTYMDAGSTEDQLEVYSWNVLKPPSACDATP